MSCRNPAVFLVTLCATTQLFFSPLVQAEESPLSLLPVEMQILAPIIVVGNGEPPPVPESTLDQGVLRHLPLGNGSLNEQLRLLPGVQLSEDYNSAATGGEILPPTISISGGKVYQNNFLVDGIGNNNHIDPAAGVRDIVTDALGRPQERFLNSDLIASVTLFDSNVPARFGNFTGGVIEAKTRNPGREVEGHLSYRTTRNQWTSFHISGANQSDFASGGNENLQPEVTKNDYGARLSFPLTEKSGILTSWHQLDSRIPLPYFLGTKTQERQQQSYFIKYVGEVSANDHLEFSVSSTPYREERFLRNVQDSDYVVKMEGLALQGEWKHAFLSGEVQLNSAYRKSENSRSAAQHFRNWAATNSKDWGLTVGSEFSVEGGFGTVKKIQESFDLKGQLRLDPIVTGAIRHELTSGIDFNRSLGSFEREEATYVYKGARFSPGIICGANDFDCVEGDQFFTSRTIYPAAKSQAELHQFGLHGEDLIRYRRLEVRPGLRFDYNDLMEQANLAPRFVASYDLFGSGSTVLRGGVNRYYGSTLLTDKLREAKAPFSSESRRRFDDRPTAWTTASAQGSNVTRFSKLETPYADELSIGLDQKVAGGVLTLQYLQREGRDEFARSYSPLQPDGLRYYTLNNLGRSQHERYSLAWQRNWTRHFLLLNASWQETKTSNQGYDALLEEEESDSRVWYNGELIYRSYLPAQVQNRPIIVNLVWIAELPSRFTFTNFSRYRSGYRKIIPTGEFYPLKEFDPESGEAIINAVPVYEEIKSSGKVIFDWKLGWSTPVYRQQLLNFSLEINNVFNSRTQTGGTTTTYEMGRQFWAGVAYDF